MRKFLLPVILGLGVAHVPAASLHDVQLHDVSGVSVHHSVSANGKVFAIWQEEHGVTFVGFHGKAIELPAVPEASTSNTHKDQGFEHVIVNPDGKYIINIIKGEVIIRNLPEGRIVWRGILERFPRPAYSIAHYFDSTANQLLFVSDFGKLVRFSIGADSTARVLSETPISFVPEGHSKWPNFVKSAAFSPDGKTLFTGNMDGEVISLSLNDAAPSIRWRATIFDLTTSGRFNDEASRWVEDIACADNCTSLLMGANRSLQFAHVDAATGNILNKRDGDGMTRAYGVGKDLFLTSVLDGNGRNEVRTITDSSYHTKLNLPKLNDFIKFAFDGGYASVDFSGGNDRQRTLRFINLSELMEAQRIEMEAQRRELEAEQRRLAQLQSQLPNFRRKLRSGHDSHCGLVVERKGDIALIETVIGQKWLKVSQLYQPGFRPCRFVNNILQD